ncbi:hypothetical protein A3G55_04410 [Candidatus Giovannonibacteria bacterium RIFCSPLOWO2_12_FULL_44_25]|uniref:Peptidase A2 domain-containing protein n=4 Tax=Candidatus Giovannoniibacteriota TaxID=1752738 RepID=A0A0G1I899_9BACT|nr:MAG: hypothetical protein UW15_C0002G0047 [Parcubacteria group bacterium GW2011_GWC1_44_10]KKT55475.1 MAG: hypothetical protein UW49_C0022G0006 [Candidatus Giovannonibacteria bacterium GW2011_GWB1_44_23]KKT59962.1 MAG: hypothetical protein UW53_C0005G0045 [Candidatus Giovannonibacteria bacterium GW2011_GWA1_44_25]KKT83028.1 MAG: hypothetical protein UW81_C0028G0001 [Candidatus Giovannonibacteria bacterium GW2011_GWC2_44_9]OGF49169.1 MAG: hypothetical protein A2120_01790 [Candidatus Giovannon
MTRFIFPYGIRFQEDGKLDIFPAAEFSVLGKRGQGIRAMFHLDSGATTSILPLSDASVLEIVLDRGKTITVRGFSGEEVVGYKRVISISLNDTRIRIPAIFVAADVPRILGREGVFPKFAVLFDEAKRQTGFFDSHKERKLIDSVLKF